MSYIDIGISAIRAAQVAINTISNNISNATTRGYHRQRVESVDRPLRLRGQAVLGGGVDVKTIQRLHAATVEQSLISNHSRGSFAGVRHGALQRVERALTPGPASVHTLVTTFFDRLEQLAANPGESVLRREVIAAAQGISQAIGDIASEFDRIQVDLSREIAASVDAVNGLASEIAELNARIRVERAQGTDPISLLDQRDRLVTDLAEYVDVDPRSILNGSDPIVAAAGGLLIGQVASTLRISSSVGGTHLSSSLGGSELSVRSGRLAGLLAAQEEIQGESRREFEQWAAVLIREIDTINATGIGIEGPQQSLLGQRRFGDATVPLTQAGGLFPIQSGSLALTLTDPSGQRRTHIVEIDANRDSLHDVIQRINAIANLSAAVDPDLGTVSLTAATGYAIDFAGRSDQVPIQQSLTGSAAVTVSGTYSGAQNAIWDVEVIQGGEVGVGDGVLLRVTNSQTGQVLGDFDVGVGYAANQPLEIAEGVSLTWTSGTLNAGDSLSVRVVGQPDQTGFLAALGLQSLFVGGSLTEFEVHPDIAASPDHLGVSRTGLSSDGQQVERYIALRQQKLFTSGTETLEERIAVLTSNSGLMVQSQQLEIEQTDLQRLQLETARDSVSGVDPNEEFLHLLEYQRAFQAASRFVTSVDETMNDLLNLVR